MATINKEGFVKFHPAGHDVECRTWYAWYGATPSASSTQIPLVVINGGPGLSHRYCLPMADLSSSPYDIPVLFYDQLGTGKSTHLPERSGTEHEAFWSASLFADELDNLLKALDLANGRQFDVLGHSWGGMLAAEWAATRKPAGLRRLVVANSPASIDTWARSIDARRKDLPQHVQQALVKGEETGDFESPEFAKALEEFFMRYLALARPWPCKEVQAMFEDVTADPTVYNTMYGPNEICIRGSLRDWSVIHLLKNIEVSTMVIGSSEDIAMDIAMKPYSDHITRVEWIKLDNAAHFSHVDQREKFIKHVADFLHD